MEKTIIPHSECSRTAFEREFIDFLKESIEKCEVEIWGQGRDLIISIPNWVDAAEKFLPKPKPEPQPLSLESLDTRLKKLEQS